jgi:hypothetical protein
MLKVAVPIALNEFQMKKGTAVASH